MLTRASCWITKYQPLWTLPRQLLSTSARQPSKPYPFPTHRNPSPHQIFHLPQTASDNDIKMRYFDLVRIYHPDKRDSTTSDEEAHARFQSITAAYDALRGKAVSAKYALRTSSTSFQDARHPTAAALRARSRHQELYTGRNERWKDHVIFAAIVATVLILVSQIFTTRRQAVNEAMMRTHHPDALQRSRTPVPISALDPNDPDRRLGE